MNETKPELRAAPEPEPLAGSGKAGSAEWLAVLCLIALFLAFNLATSDSYPTVWCDEVLFSEPAINLVKHGSFTTTVWEYNHANTFPVVNCPLYPMALVPWLAVTGTTVLAVRSLNYTLMAVAAFLIWRASWRFALVRSAWARLLMVAILHLGYGMSFSYRCSRPDILGLVCLLLLLFALAIRDRGRREVCLFLLAAATVWIGLQVALFAAFASFLAWWLLRQVAFRDLVVLAVGMLVGAGSLVLFLSWHGVLSCFYLSIIGLIGKNYAHSREVPVATGLLRVFPDTARGYLHDFSTFVLMLGLVTLLVGAWSRLSVATRRFALYCILLVFLVPLLFNLVGHDAFYYTYLRFVPATLGLFAVYSELASPGIPVHSLLKPAFLVTALVAAIVGLPVRLAFSLASVKKLPRPEVRRIVSARVRPTDVVFSDYATFFEVKEVAKLVYDPYFSSTLLRRNVIGFDFSAEQKRSISVLVIRPEQQERLTRFFGGSWTPVSGPFGDTQDVARLAGLPVIGRTLASYAAQPQNERYQVQIFRRLPNPLELASEATTPP